MDFRQSLVKNTHRNACFLLITPCVVHSNISSMLVALPHSFNVAIHSRLNHPNIVGLIGAGSTSKGVRFVVLERLDGGTLTQMLGYDTRIRDRRRRFWRKKQFAYLDVLRIARSIASALHYCHEQAIPGSMVLHRDLKPDNIGKLGVWTIWVLLALLGFIASLLTDWFRMIMARIFPSFFRSFLRSRLYVERHCQNSGLWIGAIA